MAKLNFNELLRYNDYWKKNLSPEKSEKYIALSRKLMHKVIDNDGILSGITLSYPEDCLGKDLSDYFIFQDFLEILNAGRSIQKINGSEIVTFD